MAVLTTPTVMLAAAPRTTLFMIATLPDWLARAAEPQFVAAAIERQAHAFRSGRLQLKHCAVDRLRLRAGQYEAAYVVHAADHSRGADVTVHLVGSVTSPAAARTRPAGEVAEFGSVDWQIWLPELGLNLATGRDETELASLPALLDPDQARRLLEHGLRSGLGRYRELELRSATPTVLRYKSGSQCTVRFDLAAVQEAGAVPVASQVIAKTYRKDKGRDAYAAMQQLWDSPLAVSPAVTIAEPLVYLSGEKVLVQAAVPGDRDLKAVLRAALRSETPDALGELAALLRQTGAGLAALHQSGVHYGPTVTWHDELSEVRGEVETIAAVCPDVADTLDPVLAQLELLAAAVPPDAPVTTHRSFRPQQILVDGRRISFIDFDGVCVAEPALDLALFRATVKEMGINTAAVPDQKAATYGSDAERGARIAELNLLCDTFGQAYEETARVTPRRVQLWEALDLITVVLRCWTKVKPHQLSHGVALLAAHLAAMQLV
jgi:aminoglycoside phosphotransferase (APT) family kinase protein